MAVNTGRSRSLCPHEPAVEVAGEDGEEGEGDADLEEVGGLDLVALLLQDADGGDIGGRADGREIAAERRADEQAELQHVRVAAHHGRDALHDGQHRGDIRDVVNEGRDDDGAPDDDRVHAKEAIAAELDEQGADVLDDARLGQRADDDEQAHE